MSRTTDPFDDLRYELERAHRVQLATTAEPRVARGHRGRRALVGAGFAATAAVLALVISLALAASPSSGPVDVLGRAQAALTAPDSILHYVVTTKPVTDDGTLEPPAASPGPCPTTVGVEVWQAFSPDRWRAVVPAGCARTDSQYDVRGPQELSWNDGTSQLYIPEQNRLQILRGQRADSPGAQVPSSPAALGAGDPVDAVRDLLNAGRLQDQGVTALNGRQVRSLTGQYREPGSSVTTTVRYAVDADTYDPIRIISTYEIDAATDATTGGPRERTATLQLDFSQYRREPLTATNRRSLEIQPRGRPEVTNDDARESGDDTVEERVRRNREALSRLQPAN